MPNKKETPLSRLEGRFGLPKLDRMVDLTDRISQIPSGESGKRIESILGKLEKLSNNDGNLDRATELLGHIERLDSNGTLNKVDGLLKDAKPIVNSKIGRGLTKQVDKFGKLIEDILCDGAKD